MEIRNEFEVKAIVYGYATTPSFLSLFSFEAIEEMHNCIKKEYERRKGDSSFNYPEKR